MLKILKDFLNIVIRFCIFRLHIIKIITKNFLWIDK